MGNGASRGTGLTGIVLIRGGIGQCFGRTDFVGMPSATNRPGLMSGRPDEYGDRLVAFEKGISDSALEDVEDVESLLLLIDGTRLLCVSGELSLVRIGLTSYEVKSSNDCDECDV